MTMFQPDPLTLEQDAALEYRYLVWKGSESWAAAVFPRSSSSPGG